VYLLPDGVDPTEQLGTVERLVPGSIALAAQRQLATAYPFRDLTAATVGVVEARAGYISPNGLRDGVLKDLRGDTVTIRPDRVAAVTAAPAVRLADGTLIGYDVVVLATGAWTPRLLAASGLGDGGLRTKQIQYAIWEVELAGLGSFFHAASGLYGRPDAAGSFLLGLPCDHWDVDPEAVTADVDLVSRVARCAGEVFGLAVGRRHRTVAAFDCFHESPGLRLRRVRPGLFTFTGGSGAAAKTALAVSRTAAAALTR
jgi:glycine/D-amino acid oxidase-like deaminating enzyme